MSTRENIRLIARTPLLNEMRNSDKIQGLPSILSLFRNIFNTFNNKVAGMLDSICHMTLKLLLNIRVCHIYVTLLRMPLNCDQNF